MATFQLRINMDNAAFFPTYGPELARVLRDLAERLEDAAGNSSGTVRDLNGNTAGAFKITGAAGRGRE